MKKKPSLYQVRIDPRRREEIEALKERLGTPGSLPSFVLWLIDRGVEIVKQANSAEFCVAVEPPTEADWEKRRNEKH